MKLSVTLRKKEMLSGVILMGLQLLVFPVVFKAGNRILGEPLSLAGLNFLLFVLNFGLSLLIFRRFLLENLRIALRHTGKVLGSAGLGLLAYYCAAFLLGLLIKSVRPDFINLNDQAIRTLALDAYPLTLLGTVLLVPLSEEIVYRGLLFSGLRPTSRWLAYGLSAVAFSLIHLKNHLSADPLILLFSFLQYLPAGITLAWAYEEADSIFAPILMHTAINLVSMLALR